MEIQLIDGPNDSEKSKYAEEAAEKHFSYFCNRECEYFPCHENADPENFNCLFCYCPLYVLGKGCGGNFRYTEDGVKDCSACLVPHRRENYTRITERYSEIKAVMKKLASEE